MKRNQFHIKCDPSLGKSISAKLLIRCTILLFVNCSLFIGNVCAQSLETLTTQLVDNNLELKSLEKDYHAALEVPPQVSELPDPELGIGIFPLPVETRLGAQILRLGATQMIPWKGLLESKKNLELAKAKPLYEKVAAKALELSYQLEQAYFQLYSIEQSQRIIVRNLDILNALEQLALTKVESGKASAADVLRVQLKIEELNQELAILETATTNPTSTINQLLSRSLQIPISTTDSLSFAFIPYQKEELEASIKANHPIIRMFELQQSISQQAINLNELNAKPSFGVGLDYIMVNKRSDADIARNGRDIVQIRGTVKIPLFRNKYEAKEKEELSKIEALDYKKEDLLSRFMSSIEKAYADHKTAQLKVNLYEKQKEITKAAINLLETNYSTSGNNFDELLRLEKELIDYDLKILKAIVQSHAAKSSIERYF